MEGVTKVNMWIETTDIKGTDDKGEYVLFRWCSQIPKNISTFQDYPLNNIHRGELRKHYTTIYKIK